MEAVDNMPTYNPYQNISGSMQNPLAYLQGEGVNVTGDYAQYFQDYDPSREQAAYQEYGMGQQAAMGGGRANLLAMTQQGAGMGGFGEVGFGGDPASMMRSQFGLQQEQAGMGLRGDIYGMRREQEEDWWTQLSRVEQSRGEQFDLSSGGGTDYTESQWNTGAVNQQTTGTAIAGAPDNPGSGYQWTNANGVLLKWSDNQAGWMPADQWDYYDMSQDNWA